MVVEVIKENKASFFQSEITAELGWNFRLEKSTQNGENGVKVALPNLTINFSNSDAIVKNVTIYLPVVNRGKFVPLFIKPNAISLFDLFTNIKRMRVVVGKNKTQVSISFTQEGEFGKFVNIDGYSNEEIFITSKLGEFCKSIVEKRFRSKVLENPEWTNETSCQKLNAFRDELNGALA